MSLNSLVYIVGTFWTALHILKRLFTCLRAKNGALLPFANQQQQTLTGRRRSRDVGALKLRYLQLHLETQTFNPAHDSLCTRLESSSTLKTLLIAFYDLGALCGVLGLMISLGVLAWAVLQLMMVLTSSLVVDDIPSPETRRVFKRSVPSHDVGTHESGPHDLLLNPIIPGVTVPLFHLPILVIALFGSQVVHEAGHAIAAACDGVRLMSIGASVSFILPSAFVSLSSSLFRQAPRRRLRIASAGAWHNVLIWLLLAFASWSGITTKLTGLYGLAGWRNMEASGHVIVDIAEDSPMRSIMPISSVILRLDDIPMAGDVGGLSWSETLLQPRLRSLTEDGWCILEKTFHDAPQDCCSSNKPQGATGFCFLPYASPVTEFDNGRCLDPVLVLLPPQQEATRCATSCPLSSGAEKQICVHPHISAQLTRITVEFPPWLRGGADKARTILWGGPPKEIWEQIELGTLQPQYRFLPAYLPIYVCLVSRYVSIISLSLYFFNLLPIPFLDGSQVLHAALDYFEPPSGEEYDVETLTRTTVGWGRRSMIEQGMSGLAIGLSGLMLFETVLVQIVL